jgi:hypothetical protein
MRSEKDSTRIFNCASCYLQVLVCRACDRGQLYCKPCSKITRQQAIREAKKRYQQTRKGRLKHADRQKRYMLKKQLQQKMTYTGSPQQAPHDSLLLVVEQTAEESSAKRVCHFCGSVCGPWLRHDFLSTSLTKAPSCLRSGH